MPRKTSKNPRVAKPKTIEGLLIANSTQRIAEALKAISKSDLTVEQLTTLQRAVQVLESVLKVRAPRKAQAAAKPQVVGAPA